MKSTARQLSIFDRLPPAQLSPVVEAHPAKGYVQKNIAADHNDAMSNPRPGFERALACMFRGLAEYCEAYRKEYGDNVGDDYYCGTELERIAHSLHALLSADIGRFDGGLFSSAIHRLIENDGSPEAVAAAAEFLGSAKRTDAPAPEPTPTNQLGMRRLTDRQRELLAHVRVEDNFAVYLPTEHIPDWPELKSTMVALGGKWRTKSKKRPGGFEFSDDVDAAELVRLALATGEVMDAKEADFFPTPQSLAQLLVERAGVRPGMRVLEPSAGKGAIAIAAREAGGSVWTIEALDVNATHLTSLGFTGTCRDFRSVEVDEVGTFDVVAMNPPFGSRNDIHHVRHAFAFLKPGGVLIAIMSAGVRFREDKLAQEFRAFVESLNGDIWDNDEGAFLESGTGVRTIMVRIRKPVM